MDIGRDVVEPEPRLKVTPEAAERIRRRGGRLFLWQTPVGAWLLDETASAPPARVRFRTLFDRGVEVGLGDDVTVRDHIRVVPNRWPLRGVKVFVDVKRWGRRGDVAGGGG